MRSVISVRSAVTHRDVVGIDIVRALHTIQSAQDHTGVINYPERHTHNVTTWRINRHHQLTGCNVTVSVLIIIDRKVASFRRGGGGIGLDPLQNGMETSSLYCI